MKLHPRLQPVMRIWRGGCAQALGYTVAFSFSISPQVAAFTPDAADDGTNMEPAENFCRTKQMTKTCGKIL
jgi:hypothetical protein